MLLNRTPPRLIALMIAFALGIGLIAATPAQATGRHHSHRGELVSITPLERLDRDQLADRFTEAGLGKDRVRSGIKSYRLEYRTIDVTGRPTTASQLVAMPTTDRRRLPVATFLHGTTVGRDEVASMDDGLDRLISYQLAAAGHAVAAPDYLGLGLGTGFHPYAHGESAATASLDGLRALDELARRQGRKLDRDVMITGFSQGGHSTIALGRLLASGADRKFRVGALAPVSGPFDMARLTSDLVTKDLANRAAYLAYATVSWARIHHIYDDPAEVFRAPYADTIEDLFDHTHPAEEVIPSLPQDPEELFHADYLAQLVPPSGRLAEIMRHESAVCDWRPKVSVRLYHGRDDLDVPPNNSDFCAARLRDHGGKAQVVDLGHVDHFNSILRAMPLVLEQFDQAARR